MVFVGLRDQKGDFFQRAQQIGLIHFIDVTQSSDGHLPQEIQDYIQANKVLRGLPVIRQEEPAGKGRGPEIAQKVLAIKHKIETKEEKVRVLELEVTRIAEFGEFSLDDIRYIEREGNRHIQFYCSKKGHFEGEEVPENLIYISSDHGLDYYVGINKEPRYFDKMVDMVFESNLSSLKQEIDKEKEDIQKLETELKSLAKYKSFIYQQGVLSFNQYNLDKTLGFSRDYLDDSVFAVEGWIPDGKVGQIDSIIEDLGIYREEIAVESQDKIPTYLENEGAGKIGEDLVHIYDTPSHTDKDPSLWVLFAFALFFAMIVNDAGYGFVYLAVALYLRFKFKNPTAVGKRVLNLATILALSCIIWGTLATSFFGIDIPVDSPLRRVSLLTWLSEKKLEHHMSNKDQAFQDYIYEYPDAVHASTGKEFLKATERTENEIVVNNVLDNVGRGILLELALMVGIIHITLSFLRYIKRSWSGIGWILVLIGGYLYFPHYLGETTMLHYVFGVSNEFGATEGLQLMYTGIVIAVILALIQHRLGGLAEPMNLIQVFADVLSYLRLYALGLASGIVAQTINELYGAMPVLIAIVLIVLAHCVNMLLGIMSGVIHGLRLNFLEWYHYSFEGGGKLFDPLRLYEVE